MRYFLIPLFLTFIFFPCMGGCKRRSQIAREAAIATARIQHNCNDVTELSFNAVKMEYKLDVCGTTRKYRCDLRRERNGRHTAKCSELK